MTHAFLDIATTPAVHRAQVAQGVRRPREPAELPPSPDGLTEHEVAFIAARDSFYLATVSETGWPYMQHRGGQAGFLKVLDSATLGFADFRGNRQYISLGNLGANHRASLFLMDYPHRARLKIYATLEAVDLDADPTLAARLVDPTYRARPERVLLAHIHAYDWNCPQHITPRFTEVEIGAAVAPLHRQLASLEAENHALRERLNASSPGEPTP